MRLFERNRRGVALTPAGVALLDDARDVLARAARAAERAREAGSGSRGRLRLTPHALADRRAWRARSSRPSAPAIPDVALELSVGYTSLHAEQLRHGLIDVAFVRPPLLDPGIEEHELAREPLVCVLPSAHRAGPPPRDRPRRPARRAARVVAARPRPGAVGGDARRGLRRGPLAGGDAHRARGGAARARRRRGRRRELHHARALAHAARPGRGLPPLHRARADRGHRAGVAARRATCRWSRACARWPRRSLMPEAPARSAAVSPSAPSSPAAT